MHLPLGILRVLESMFWSKSHRRQIAPSLPLGETQITLPTIVCCLIRTPRFTATKDARNFEGKERWKSQEPTAENHFETLSTDYRNTLADNVASICSPVLVTINTFCWIFSEATGC